MGKGRLLLIKGRVADGNAPANGNYDFAFSLFATNCGGTPVAGPVTNLSVVVRNGVFTTAIDFGPGVFAGSNLWLDIAVETNDTGPFFDLSPRQPIMPTPYSIFSATASNLSGGLPASELSGTIANSNLPANPVFSGTVSAPSFNGTVASTNITGVIPSTLLPGGVVTNTLLGLPVLNLPNSGNRPALLFTLPGSATTMCAIGDSITYGSLANPLTDGFAYLLANSLGLGLFNFGAPGHCVADYGPQVNGAVAQGAPLDTFEGGVNDEILDPDALSIAGFTIGLLGQLSHLEVGTNHIAGTNMVVVSGTWSNILGNLDTSEIEGCGVLSTAPASAIEATVAGKTIIVSALDFDGNEQVGGSFSVTIDGTTVCDELSYEQVCFTRRPTVPDLRILLSQLH